MLRGNFLVSITNFIFGLIELLLGLRVMLKLFGANTASDFVQWVYETSQPLLEPFEGMFPSPEFGRNLELEISALFALVAYALVAYLITELVATLERGTSRVN